MVEGKKPTPKGCPLTSTQALWYVYPCTYIHNQLINIYIYFLRNSHRQKTTTNQNAELWSSIPTDSSATQLLHLRLRDTEGQTAERLLRARETGSLL